MSAYLELLQSLFRRRRLGVDLGLERVANVAAALDYRIPTVRVAGTNGKGSTVVLVDAALTASGIRTGRFTSPHLNRFTERFALAGREVLPDEVAAAANVVDEVGGSELTFFEYATALALVLFRRVNLAILEVGLGGRLDATRAVSAQCVGIASVGLDHREVLGTSLEQIAREKAGACEPGAAAVIGIQSEPALADLLEQMAIDLGATPVVRATEPYEGPLRLVGAHQRDNAALAWQLLECIADRGLAPRDRQVWAEGFARATVPGRMELIGDRPACLLDVAHNPQAATALAMGIAELCDELDVERVVVVLGVSADKDAPGIASAFAQVVDEVWVTKSEHSRAMAIEELRAAASTAGVAVGGSAETVPEALERARARVGEGGLLVVAGSVFTVGEARALLTGEKRDPATATEP